MRACYTDRFRTGSPGFGLVELLIAIAVIGVLTLLMFSVLKSVNEQSGLTRCMANLRSLSVAMQGYSNDNNGFLLEDELLRPNGSSTVLWPHQLNQYLDTNFSLISVNPNLAKTTALHCPAEKELIRPYSFYSINRELNRRLSGEASRIHSTAVVSPSKYVLLADSSTSSIIYTDSAKKMKDFTKMDRRHGGRPNLLFADGHVVNWKEPLVGLSDTGGNTPENRAMWQARYRP